MCSLSNFFNHMIWWRPEPSGPSCSFKALLMTLIVILSPSNLFYISSCSLLPRCLSPPSSQVLKAGLPSLWWEYFIPCLELEFPTITHNGSSHKPKNGLPSWCHQSAIMMSLLGEAWKGCHSSLEITRNPMVLPRDSSMVLPLNFRSFLNRIDIPSGFLLSIQNILCFMSNGVHKSILAALFWLIFKATFFLRDFLHSKKPLLCLSVSLSCSFHGTLLIAKVKAGIHQDTAWGK